MLALTYVDDRLFAAGIEGGPVAWLHDEIVLEVREDQSERAAEILKQAMIDGFAETFPGAPLNGLVEPHVGASWGAAKAGEIQTASGVPPEPDFALVDAERVKPLVRDVDEDEAKARAFEHLVTACDDARLSEGVAMSHSASRAATGAFRAEGAADTGRGRPEDFPEASGAAEAHARVAPTFYEFFAGGGMAREGLGPEWVCLFANDNDPRKGAAYVANWTGRDLVVCDVAALTTADLPSADLAWASFPCQDVSLAGDRAGLGGARSGSFWPFMKLMRGLRADGRAPRMIVIENVCGLLTSHYGKDFDAICDALADAGYRFGAVVIDAALFVPQSRERVFIVAVDAAVCIPAGLIAGETTATFHPPVLVAACQRQRNPIWWRLPVPPKRNTTFADIVEDEPGGVRWNSQAETGRLLEMMTPVHLAKIETAKRARRRMVGGLYRRIRKEADGKKVQRAEVRFDDVAGCLRVPTGGSSRQTIVIVEGASVTSRLLSPREAARLMGLSDDYVLPTNYNDAYGLMGDGVVVPVVRHLAEHILEPVLQASTGEPTRRAIA